jgi:hypothetical protein
VPSYERLKRGFQLHTASNQVESSTSLKCIPPLQKIPHFPHLESLQDTIADQSKRLKKFGNVSWNSANAGISN